ncbi:MAG: tyrosine-type recombinase/integrase [Planctomycetota bacterium]
MANLKKRGDYWSVEWWWQGKRRIKSLRIKIQDKPRAERIRVKVEQALLKLRRGLFPKASKLLNEGYDITDVLFPHGPTAHLLDKEVAVEDDNPLTVSDLATQYVEHLRKNQTDLHARSVKSRISHLVAEAGDGRRVTTLDRRSIDQLIEQRRKEGAGDTTISNELTSIKAMLQWAADTELIDSSPIRSWPSVKTGAADPFLTKADIEEMIAQGNLAKEEVADLGQRMILTPPDIDRLITLAKAGNPDLVLPLMLVSTTGIRRGEMVRVRKQDFDSRSGRLTVRSRKGSRRQTATTRTIDVHASVLPLLRQHHRRLKKGSLLFPVFDVGKSKRSRASSRPIEDRRADRAGRLMRQLIQGTEFELLGGWHALRHSFISICVWKGFTFQQISQWSGHIEPETQRRYTHYVGEASKALMDTLPFAFSERESNNQNDA